MDDNGHCLAVFTAQALKLKPHSYGLEDAKAPPFPATLAQRCKSLEKATRLVQKLAKDACLLIHLVVSFDQGS